MMTMVDDYDEDGDNSNDEVDYNDDENDDNDGNKNMVKKKVTTLRLIDYHYAKFLEMTMVMMMMMMTQFIYNTIYKLLAYDLSKLLSTWKIRYFHMRQVTRYQGWPGQATAYMVGRLGILNAREYATNALGEQFSLKDFHYQVMWLRECEFHDEFANNYILLLITLRRFWILRIVHNWP